MYVGLQPTNQVSQHSYIPISYVIRLLKQHIVTWCMPQPTDDNENHTEYLNA